MLTHAAPFESSAMYLHAQMHGCSYPFKIQGTHFSVISNCYISMMQ